MSKEIKWCVHLIIRNGKVVNIITHLSDFPKNGVVHLKGDKIYTFNEFKKSHVNDHHELVSNDQFIVIDDY